MRCWKVFAIGFIEMSMHFVGEISTISINPNAKPSKILYRSQKENKQIIVYKFWQIVFDSGDGSQTLSCLHWFVTCIRLWKVLHWDLLRLLRFLFTSLGNLNHLNKSRCETFQNLIQVATHATSKPMFANNGKLFLTARIVHKH